MNASQSYQNKPLVSVGIPTLNGGEKLIGVVNSVLNCGMDHDQLEIIISDNASTDQGVTQRVCEQLASQHPQIRYYRQSEGIGWLPNWNFVMQKATGKYFMWLADDDRIIDGVMEKYVDFLEANEEYSLVCGKIDYYAGDEWVRAETGLSQEQSKPSNRVYSYYRKVGDGAMVYGLMRTELAQKIEHINRMAMDWHHVAGMAFLGKIKQLDFTGYNKFFGGRSSSFVRYAKLIGLPGWWGHFPTLRIGIDVFDEILSRVPIYKSLSRGQRFWLALKSSAGIILPWYLWGNPKRYAVMLMHSLKLKTPGDRRRELYNAEHGTAK